MHIRDKLKINGGLYSDVTARLTFPTIVTRIHAVSLRTLGTCFAAWEELTISLLSSLSHS
jgi:hypothetical protein